MLISLCTYNAHYFCHMKSTKVQTLSPRHVCGTIVVQYVLECLFCLLQVNYSWRALCTHLNSTYNLCLSLFFAPYPPQLLN